jgi:hypothetical protein
MSSVAIARAAGLPGQALDQVYTDPQDFIGRVVDSGVNSNGR